MSLQTKTNNKTITQVERFREDMLCWYDDHQRVLPWRARRGQERDPYKTWLSEVMLQQTTVAAVIPYFNKFVDKWPSVFDIAKASQEDVMDNWAGLGYYSRARNLHKCANLIVREFNGVFPNDLKGLKSLPGVGDYISAAVRSIAFDLPSSVVDGNVERVLSRYYCVKDPLPHSKKHLKDLSAELSEGRTDRPGDFAQAMMDLGATICTPKSPSCMICPLQQNCAAHKAGLQAELPYKIKKGEQPQKYGSIYWIESECGQVLLQRRPDKGMLARMVGFPTNEWILDQTKSVDHLDLVSGKKGLSRLKDIKVKHTFTHFDIHLDGYKLLININDLNINEQLGYYWIKSDELANVNFPTVFKKFYKFMV